MAIGGNLLFIVIGVIAVLAIIGYLIWDRGRIKKITALHETALNRRMYELAILKELGDRVGYSLDVHQIIDIITGSLHQFIEYSVVSYMLLAPEKVIFKLHLERSVSRAFIDDLRTRMLGSLSALLDREFKKDQVEEVISGAILVPEVDDPIRSFFNIPLVIGEKVVGVLTISHTKAGLYKEEEMTILYKIVGQASQAVTRLQDVVKTEQEKLNAMVESMADGVVMTDTDYRIVVVNPAAKIMIGAPDKKEISIFDFIDNLGGKFDIRGQLEESVKLRKPHLADRILLNDKFFQIFVFPVLSKTKLREGEVLGGVVIFHDITHEIELEKVRQEFTSMVVHELRSPLDGIKKIAEAILGKEVKRDSSSFEEYLQMIHQNSSNMLNLINDILDLAKLEAGKFEVHPVATDIKEVIEKRVAFYKFLADDKKLKLSAVVDKTLPLEIMVDPEAIKQSLDNFISNALKFTEKGEVTVAAFVHNLDKNITEEIKSLGTNFPTAFPGTLKIKAPVLVIAVADNGVGVSPEGLGQLFSKFKQLSSKAMPMGKRGSGLGLAITKGLIEAHGGEVGAVSTSGVGSVFYFVIPLLLPTKS
ncbi:MAG: ATP-binding protein [Candidatus Paceibacterota bacterium]|jgi:signal transduction histidine kinase